MAMIETLETRGFFAFAGAIDTTFGNAGRDTLDFGQRSLDTLFGSVVQPDGKIILVGSTNSPIGNGTDIAVVRLNPDASLDTSFGGLFADDGETLNPGGGLFEIPLITSDDSAYGVALQPDGKILVVGAIADDFGTGSIVNTQSIVIRLLPNGTPDSTFGFGDSAGEGFVALGLALNPFDPGNSEARAVALQADGKIIVAGASDIDISVGAGNFAVARLNPDGSPDLDFGPFGTGINVDGIDGVFTEAFGIAIEPATQKILLTGTAISPEDAAFTQIGGIFLTVRLTPDGLSDESFGTGGVAVTTFTPYDTETVVPIAATVTLQPDGKILTAGLIIRDDSPTSGFGLLGFALARLNADGTPDLSFGGRASQLLGNQAFDTPGTVETYFIGRGVNAFASASQINVLPDGKILLSGKATLDSVNFSSTAISRYRSDGTLDSTFNRNGRLLLSPTGVVNLAANGNAREDFNAFARSANSAVAVVPGGGILVLAQNANTITATRLIADGADLTTSVNTIKAGTYLAGAKLSVTLRVSNQGTLNFTGRVPFSLRLSADRELSDADINIPVSTLTALTLKPGTTKAVTLTFNLPAGELNGQFFILASANANRAGVESNFLNNLGAAPNAITLTPAFIELTAELTVSPPPIVSVKKKSAFTVRLINSGTILAKGNITLQLLASTDGNESAEDARLFPDKPARLSLKANGSATLKFSTLTPGTLAPGTYTLILKLDASALNARNPIKVLVTPRTLQRN